MIDCNSPAWKAARIADLLAELEQLGHKGGAAAPKVTKAKKATKARR